jgi:hypothetical protein
VADCEHKKHETGGGMNETCDRCGPAVRAAYRVARTGELYLCRHCTNLLWPALSAEGWNIREWLVTVSATDIYYQTDAQPSTASSHLGFRLSGLAGAKPAQLTCPTRHGAPLTASLWTVTVVMTTTKVHDNHFDTLARAT